jgi:SAM-dependent methyltransferase
MYAARIGNESIGISLEEEQIRRARIRASVLKIDQVQFIQADLRHLDQWMAQLGTFDQVICLETIEHILNDHKLLADLAVLLRPGGRLLLTTPFEHHKPLWGDRLSEREDGGHVRWGYAHAEMRALFNQCGLDVVVEEYISGFISQQITNLMRGLSPENSRLTWALTLPLRLCQVLDVPLTRLLNYPYLCIGMVGIKRDGDLR